MPGELAAPPLSEAGQAQPAEGRAERAAGVRAAPQLGRRRYPAPLQQPLKSTLLCGACGKPPSSPAHSQCHSAPLHTVQPVGHPCRYGMGYSFGLLTGVLTSQGIPHHRVDASVWKRGLGLFRTGKDGSLALARQLFPQAEQALRCAVQLGRAAGNGCAGWWTVGACAMQLHRSKLAGVSAESCSSCGVRSSAPSRSIGMLQPLQRCACLPAAGARWIMAGQRPC